ncbi:hypothetical protein NPIL_582151 [Nephila pilipes]|uniref:Uncharacterized protein n=1 Tax=Nephila pilipes TaxID=299642 RepID=A0A8X6N8G8_NEPPI|nr:hypothetical protein NPIL_582151 [Nephila pilipes]
MSSESLDRAGAQRGNILLGKFCFVSFVTGTIMVFGNDCWKYLDLWESLEQRKSLGRASSDFDLVSSPQSSWEGTSIAFALVSSKQTVFTSPLG